MWWFIYGKYLGTKLDTTFLSIISDRSLCLTYKNRMWTLFYNKDTFICASVHDRLHKHHRNVEWQLSFFINLTLFLNSSVK